MLNRRSFLCAAPAAAISVVAVAPANAAAPIPDTRPHDERVREKVAELKALMREVYSFERWHWVGIVSPADTDGCRILLSLTERHPGHRIEDTER